MRPPASSEQIEEAVHLNIAAKALNLGLAGMTQLRWDLLSPEERQRLQDLSGLTPQLRGLERYRVEVVDVYGETRRFWVGRSSGWRPCHIENKLLTSSGGVSADRVYKSVRVVRSS
jgi:hypothetical protein